MRGCVRRMFRGIFAAITVFIAPWASADESATWPQWRGPTRDGQVAGPTWPDNLQGDRLKQLWRVELGPGYPGPIVTADRVFVAETKDQSDEIVRGRSTAIPAGNCGNWVGRAR
jgi:outer membrane protein assembly factor BamB